MTEKQDEKIKNQKIHITNINRIIKHIDWENYYYFGTLILTVIIHSNVYRRSVWRINNISVFAKFFLCNFVYCIPLVSCIGHSFIHWIWGKLKCTLVCSPDDCFHMITSRPNNIYISIVVFSETRVISCIQCYNQSRVVWNCWWYNNIDSVATQFIICQPNNVWRRCNC